MATQVNKSRFGDWKLHISSPADSSVKSIIISLYYFRISRVARNWLKLTEIKTCGKEWWLFIAWINVHFLYVNWNTMAKFTASRFFLYFAYTTACMVIMDVQGSLQLDSVRSFSLIQTQTGNMSAQCQQDFDRLVSSTNDSTDTRKGEFLLIYIKYCRRPTKKNTVCAFIKHSRYFH